MKKDVLNTAEGKAHRMMELQPGRIDSVIQVDDQGNAIEKFAVTEIDNPSERRGNLTAEQLLQKTGNLPNRTTR